MAVDPSTIQPPDSPDAKFVWGYDWDQGDWVRVDRQALEGSTIGNLARAAGRGFESVYQGVRELSTGQAADPNLIARQQAAAAGAPIAEAVGGFAPEMLAGGLAATATGGLGLIPAIAGEGLAAGGMSFLRPGSIDQRLTAAAESAALQGVGSAAARGIFAGVRMGRGILDASTSRVAAGVEAGAERVSAAQAERAAVEAEQAQAAASEAGTGLRSVGAAQTPADELGGQYAEAGRAAAQTEAAGADIGGDTSIERLAQRADELGMRKSAAFGSRQGSAARLMQSVHDLNPFGDIGEQMVKTNNQEVVGNLLSRALGSDNPKSVNLLDDLGQAEERIGERFNYVEGRLPAQMPKKTLAADLAKISESESRGYAGTASGQKFIDNAVANMNASEGQMMTAAQWMDTRRTMQAEMARLYAKGETVSGDTVGKAVEKMDDMATRYLKQKGRPKLMDYWERSRRQYQVLMAAKRAGAVDVGTGDVNPRTLIAGLKKDRSSGGFGLRGPKRGTPERDLFDALQVALHNQSGVPMTGARMVVRDLARSQGGKLAAGAAGIFGARSIFD